MKESRALVESWEVLRTQGAPCVLATVVGVAGSAYRRPGARMLMSEEHWLIAEVRAIVAGRKGGVQSRNRRSQRRMSSWVKVRMLVPPAQ